MVNVIPSMRIAMLVAVGCMSSFAVCDESGPKQFVNTVGIAFVAIPSGTFTMGSPANEKGRRENESQHQVTISKPFYLSVVEINQSQYQAIMGSNPSVRHKPGKGSDAFPVDSVTWVEATSFCSKLSQLPEEKRKGRIYRLPTEAEWEYACRAGGTDRYTFGDSEANLSEYAVSGGESTQPVGSKKPNRWGLRDMHGSVWEWCSDWYAEYDNAAVIDSNGPTTGVKRVRRGGCWCSLDEACRSAMRASDPPEYKGDIMGLRVLLEMPAADSSDADQTGSR